MLSRDNLVVLGHSAGTDECDFLLTGLVDSPPSENCQRILILISKLLQNLANEILPGKKQPG